MKILIFFVSYVNHLSDGSFSTNERSTLNPISIGFFFQSLIEIEVDVKILLPCQVKYSFRGRQTSRGLIKFGKSLSSCRSLEGF